MAGVIVVTTKKGQAGKSHISYTGEFTIDPDAKLIETVPVIDAHILSLAGDKGSELATGGMVTKLHAAQIATAAGCEMVIANGEKPEVLYDIVDGKRVGTRFLIPKSEEELL